MRLIGLFWLTGGRYGYWHDALLHKGKLKFIQYLAVSLILVV